MKNAPRNDAGQILIQNKGWHDIVSSTDMESIHGAPYRMLETKAPKGRKIWMVIEANGKAKAAG